MRLILILFVTLSMFSPVVMAQEGAGGAVSATEQQASPAVDDLIRILQDDAARAQLIDRLRAEVPEDTAASADVADFSIARQLANYTQGAAQGASATARAVVRAVAEVRGLVDGSLHLDVNAIQTVLVGLLAVAAGLFGSYFLLRLAANAAMSRILRDVRRRGWPTRIGKIASAIVIDGISIVFAWGLGYVVALNVETTPTGQVGLYQALLLNAFLVVELSKLASRVLLAPRHPEARFVPVADSNAVYWSFWIGRVISLIGYTFMFASPALAQSISRALAAGVQVVVMSTAVAIGVLVVLQNRDDVRAWLAHRAERRNHDPLGRLLLVLGQYWHILAILYLVGLLLVWFANPDDALPFMLGATAQSIIAVIIGVLVLGFVGRFVSGGLELPEDVQERLPLLEGRLKAFVPRVMLVIRWIVLALVVIAIGQAWSLFDFVGWLSTDEGLGVAGAVTSAALIVVVAVVLHIVVASWVEYRLSPKGGRAPSSRETTLLNLFKNAFTVALVIFGSMLALAQIGVNIAPLLAGAGVVGLAIGFGAQKLVQDIITGIFIQFENIMNVGDVVAVGDKSGVVEKLTIRSVTIRDLSGTVHLVPFSSVDQVSNMMRGFSYHVAEIGVAYDSDITAVKAAMHEAFEQVMQTELSEFVLADFEMQGVTGFGDSAITVRGRIKTVPGQQWGVGRRYNEYLKQVFSERGIEIPYPHVTFVQGGEARASGRVLRHGDRGASAEQGEG
ncbi:mechanosensitive ion channel [Devosia sp. PTR5]|uniref:Mechanosensitive ion channel n=1 Tax=Devosia oryzisoli TaxID=2774138 RepID=A0A927FYB4_9HYPH|nr:mechanosensitive ion channel domain-containing protein [Devosia oryzisoli]MBD8067178.1 mechanosensitive ion channel [Devosia oryzisoli]